MAELKTAVPKVMEFSLFHQFSLIEQCQLKGQISLIYKVELWLIIINNLKYQNYKITQISFWRVGSVVCKFYCLEASQVGSSLERFPTL